MSVERLRFAHGPLDDVASVMANTHPRANQYLEQAPVIAVLACEKLGSHLTYGELDRFAARVGAEPRLRDLLDGYGGTAPMRRLSASALRSKDRTVLVELRRLDASTLAQSIPGDSQRVWLDGIADWLRLAPANKRDRARFNVGWIARRLGEDLSRFEQVSALIDYLGRGRATLNERWTWAKAMEAVQTWHHGLRDERALERLLADKQQAANFDRVICKSGLPDTAAVDGYDFTVLRTMRQLREEGATMHHCVASYAGSVKSGVCAIASIKREGVNVATLQIDRDGSVGQIKTYCNGAVLPVVRQACETYALLHWRAPEAAA